jgi:ABC-type xylose transport system permease subunit
VVEPFLIVGLIAGVRRLLLVTAQIAESTSEGGVKFQWNPQGIEIVVLLALVLGMTLALILWRRYYGRRATAEE